MSDTVPSAPARPLLRSGPAAAPWGHRQRCGEKAERGGRLRPQHRRPWLFVRHRPDRGTRGLWTAAPAWGAENAPSGRAAPGQVAAAGGARSAAGRATLALPNRPSTFAQLPNLSRGSRRRGPGTPSTQPVRADPPRPPRARTPVPSLRSPWSRSRARRAARRLHLLLLPLLPLARGRRKAPGAEPGGKGPGAGPPALPPPPRAGAQRGRRDGERRRGGESAGPAQRRRAGRGTKHGRGPAPLGSASAPP